MENEREGQEVLVEEADGRDVVECDAEDQQGGGRDDLVDGEAELVEPLPVDGDTALLMAVRVKGVPQTLAERLLDR